MKGVVDSGTDEVSVRRTLNTTGCKGGEGKSEIGVRSTKGGKGWFSPDASSGH